MVSLFGEKLACADRCTTGSSRRHVDFVVAVTSLSLWTFFLVACVLGYVRFVAVFACLLDTDTIYRLHATWRDHLELFTVFCLVFLRHRVLDLDSTIAFIVVAYERGVRSSSEVCLDRGLEPCCTVQVHLMFVIVSWLVFFQGHRVCECLRFSILPQMYLTVLLDAFHAMYNYRRAFLSRSPQNVLTHTNKIQSEVPVPFRASVARPSRHSNPNPMPSPSPSDTAAPRRQQTSQP